jgi:hypothetical protein
MRSWARYSSAWCGWSSGSSTSGKLLNSPTRRRRLFAAVLKLFSGFTVYELGLLAGRHLPINPDFDFMAEHGSTLAAAVKAGILALVRVSTANGWAARRP